MRAMKATDKKPKDVRIEVLRELANEGGDTGEIAKHSLWIEYGIVYGRDEA